MKLNSARQAWHEAFYGKRNSNANHFATIHRLGTQIQQTEIDRSLDHCEHGVLAGYVQQAVASLSPDLQLFGHHMYGPEGIIGDPDDVREAAEALVFDLAYSRVEKMYAKKMERARAVAAGVLYRYRRMHQGGQSSMPDPMPKPEGFRAWILAEKGISLSSEQWTREWEGFIDTCFLACDDLDKQALIPVSSILALMKEAA
ncbi:MULTISPECIES: hypothetical protein [Pseudomonas]|uniref:hypothetical protein n=1 Tax=Pseudomonas TaxID=286 RepID=UPI0002A1A10A|nr:MULTISPECIES: hypothetical protein [Pseudomonas]MBB1606530.1 hypothetical protein [Pseudomonas sp. UMC76]MBB1640697.1 hypothetical protein [Pseudomonas sp. UME83]MDN6874101.1 hypothetical protein [Pseudomonas citronellolis]NTX88169.1 hypothetical protein [Pseudomonas sp. UMA643]NTY18742.1 hypothetical protein [Pseudomonas sp. UMC3103]